MREFKFRAWDKWDKRMIQPHDGDFIKWHAMSNWKQCLEVMQYTGLKDKNGVEIYEGDILTSPYYPFQDDGKYNYHGVIEWDQDSASFYMTKRLVNRDKNGISDGISEPIEDIEDFEVIGNIYENPEILEGAQS